MADRVADITKLSAGKGHAPRNLSNKFRENLEKLYGKKKFVSGRRFKKVYR